MIYIGDKEISLINVGNRAISAIYKAGRIIWQAVRSCFGNGLWINNKPWINDEPWKNN